MWRNWLQKWKEVEKGSSRGAQERKAVNGDGINARLDASPIDISERK